MIRLSTRPGCGDANPALFGRGLGSPWWSRRTEWERKRVG